MNINKDFQIIKFRSGIKLVKPEAQYEFVSNKHPVKSLLEMPFAVYFEDAEHNTQVCNDITAMECGYDSKEALHSNPWHKYFTKNTIQEPLANCEEIIRNNTFKITTEKAIRNDGNSTDVLSIRMPCYDSDNSIMGLFGCSILMGINPLAESLTKITSLGLLNYNQLIQTDSLLGKEVNSEYFTKRELQILQLTVRGKTAKQIAETIFLSKYTVEEYLSNIRNKFSVKSKSELIDKAIDYFF